MKERWRQLERFRSLKWKPTRCSLLPPAALLPASKWSLVMKSRGCSGRDSLLSAADRLRAQAPRRDASVDELRWRGMQRRNGRRVTCDV